VSREAVVQKCGGSRSGDWRGRDRKVVARRAEAKEAVVRESVREDGCVRVDAEGAACPTSATPLLLYTPLLAPDFLPLWLQPKLKLKLKLKLGL
jgi:hypothetical protein